MTAAPPACPFPPSRPLLLPRSRMPLPAHALNGAPPSPHPIHVGRRGVEGGTAPALVAIQSHARLAQMGVGEGGDTPTPAPLTCVSRTQGAEGLCHARVVHAPLTCGRCPRLYIKRGRKGERRGVLCSLSCQTECWGVW